MELFLLQKIESLRLEMVTEAIIQGNLTHVKVIELSQLLDLYIITYEKKCKTGVA